MEFEVKDIDIKKIHQNKGQIEGLPANPRKISKEHLHKLVESIKENPEMMGLREILVVEDPNKADNYIVIGGNMRLTALKKLDYKEAPVKIIKDATIEQLKAYIIKDNVSGGEWDEELLKQDWDIDQLNDWGLDDLDFTVKEEKQAKEDNFDADKDKIETKVKNGELWQLGRHYLKCGDATKEEDYKDLLGDKQADLIITDPPYNVNIETNKIRKSKQHNKILNDNMEHNIFHNFLVDCFKNMNKYLKPSRSFYIWCLNGLGFEEACKDAEFQIRQWLIWYKSTFLFGWADYLKQYEVCLYGWKNGKEGHYFRYGTIQTNVLKDDELDFDTMKKEDMKKLLKSIFENNDIQTDIFEYARPTGLLGHPTSKPVPMIGKLINNSSEVNNIVLDVFGGSGTTLIACEELNRICYMMELDPKYCDLIIARWEKLTGEKAKKIK